MNTNLLTTQWHTLPEATVRRLQTEKLRRYLRDVVVPFSPHYRALFHEHGFAPDDLRTLEDLDCLPLTSKLDLSSTPEHPNRIRDFLVLPDKKILARRPANILGALIHGREHVRRALDAEFRPVFMTSTTGRSAEPIPFLFTRYDLDHLALTGKRVFEICGAAPDLRLLNLFPFAPHLAFWQTHYGGVAFGVFQTSTGGGKVMGTDGNLRLIRKLKPDILIGMPTFLYHVLHQAAAEGVRLETLRRLVLGGEKVPDGMKRKLVNLAAELGSPGLDIVSTYGFTEARMAWGECANSFGKHETGFHLYPDHGLVELIDPKTGRLVPPGQPGEIVFTPLDGRLTYERCPGCGRTVPRLLGNISRSTEIKSLNFGKLKGTLVDFNQLEHVLDNVDDVGSWQLELRKHHDDPLEVDELILHVQKINGTDEARLTHDLRARLYNTAELHPNRIEFHSAEELRRRQGVGVQLKESKILDNRPGAVPQTSPPASSHSVSPHALTPVPQASSPASSGGVSPLDPIPTNRTATATQIVSTNPAPALSNLTTTQREPLEAAK